MKYKGIRFTEVVGHKPRRWWEIYKRDHVKEVDFGGSRVWTELKHHCPKEKARELYSNYYDSTNAAADFAILDVQAELSKESNRWKHYWQEVERCLNEMK